MQTLFDTSESIKYFKAPPLPFMGNKKNALKLVESLIKEIRAKYNEQDLIFLDCFGGSGFLSHTFKYHLPNARVIYNDYDDYLDRVKNAKTTEEILGRISALVTSPKNAKITEEKKQKIISILEEYEQRGQKIDYVSISSFVLFQGNYAKDLTKLKKAQFYYKFGSIKKETRGYLTGVEAVKMDFKAMIEKYKAEAKISGKIAFLILDPPYLQTNTDVYNTEFYRLPQFLELIDRIEKPFMLFSSLKSDIVDFLAWYDRLNPKLKGRKIRSYNLCDVYSSVIPKTDFCFYEI
ncbi:hypothetical protein LS70_003810 [Helicobacter sp. MIT 11-5569]|uniref:hypothetical protein n=1 Tax=Helicobacter sp. MIT 11-5569 TaxID=1548151 RepID=UPI00051FAE96|nr:hypothetical protein [Helicobacter sp. MIT 11-5569]TLD83944.1 hypothetical protein LS70_003810 [Helicobacter sp. MIT 11-5569]